MSPMPVSLPPQRKRPSEAKIEAVINKGGTPTTESQPDAPKHINIRLTGEIIGKINELRARRPRKPGSPKLGISSHDWIVEAVLEKLQREGRKL